MSTDVSLIFVSLFIHDEIKSMKEEFCCKLCVLLEVLGKFDGMTSIYLKFIYTVFINFTRICVCLYMYAHNNPHTDGC